MVRCFAAVEVPSPAVRRSLESVQSLLRQSFDPSRSPVKWVPSHQFHFTLKFLGEIELAQVALAVSALRQAAAAAAPFTLEVVGLGAFPDLNRPSVLWAGTGQGRQELVRLAEQVEEAMAAAGFPREARPFRPHLTLGRVRERGPAPARVRERLDGQPVSYGSWPVERVVLMRSELLMAGPRYTALEAVALGNSKSST